MNGITWLIVVLAFSRSGSIYEYSTQGEPIRVFAEHKQGIRGLVHLCDDILASVNSNGIHLRSVGLPNFALSTTLSVPACHDTSMPA